MTPLRILFVGSSNVGNRQFVDRLSNLDRIDFVAWISSGGKAIGEYSTLFPDVVIIDAVADDMSGVEVARWLKEQNRQLKIVMVSEASRMEFLNVSREMGLHGYFTKSISAKDMDRALDDLQNERFCYSNTLTELVFPEWMVSVLEKLSSASFAAASLVGRES